MMEENKRTTAPVSSVAADVGQSQINNSTIISDKQQKDNLYTEKNMPIVSEEQFENVKTWDKHFKNFYISGKSEKGALLFTCKEIDEKNKCKVYFFRGLGCRLYPKTDSKFLINGGKPLDGCGYYFEPDKSFKSYLKKNQ